MQAYKPILVMGLDSPDPNYLEGILTGYKGNVIAVDYRRLNDLVTGYKEAGLNILPLANGAYMVLPYSLEGKLNAMPYERNSKDVSQWNIYSMLNGFGFGKEVIDDVKNGHLGRASAELLKHKESVTANLSQSEINSLARRGFSILFKGGAAGKEARGMLKEYFGVKAGDLYSAAKGYFSGGMERVNSKVYEIAESLGFGPGLRLADNRGYKGDNLSYLLERLNKGYDGNGGYKRNKKAFTLIELLVVVAIIAILAALMLPVIGGVKDKVKTAMVKKYFRDMSVACQTYCTGDYGEGRNLPEHIGDLATTQDFGTKAFVETGVIDTLLPDKFFVDKKTNPYDNDDTIFLIDGPNSGKLWYYNFTRPGIIAPSNPSEIPASDKILMMVGSRGADKDWDLDSDSWFFQPWNNTTKSGDLYLVLVKQSDGTVVLRFLGFGD